MGEREHPSPATLRGLAPGLTGGLPAEEWVRRLRDRATPDAEALAALEDAHHVDAMGLFDGEVTMAALHAAGYTLVRRSERDALPSVEELATILWTRVRLEGVLHVRDKSEARDLAAVIRAAIEGGR